MFFPGFVPPGLSPRWARDHRGVVRVVVAAVAAGVLLWFGVTVLRALGRPAPPPPPPGTLRRVNLRYRCNICGAEVKMVSAAEELPEPPRHCMDEMQLVAPPDE